jgi:hypothetical protein
MSESKIPHAAIGRVGGSSMNLMLPHDGFESTLEKMRSAYAGSIKGILEPWQE